MHITNIVKFFYVIYTIYILLIVDVTDISLYIILPAIILMWINYIVFKLGYSFSLNRKIVGLNFREVNNYQTFHVNDRLFIVIGIVTIIFSVLAVQFYTGQTPVSVVNNMLTGISLYNEYQSYFSESNLNNLSFSKLPYIFMLFFIKFMLFYSYIEIFLYRKKINIIVIICIAFITLSHVYVGIGRGTNFEFFELVMLIIYVVLSKVKNKLPIKQLLIVGSIIVIMIAIYFKTVSNRGFIFNHYISKDVNFNPESIVNYMSPELAFIIVNLFFYFGFGLFYIAKYTSEVWFSSVESFFMGIIPMGYKSNDGVSLSETMLILVDVGVKWNPDITKFVDSIGYIGLIFLCFIGGSILRHMHVYKLDNSMVYLTQFIILLQMISLPVGNFIGSSSASKLIIITLTIYWIWRFFVKLKIKV